MEMFFLTVMVLLALSLFWILQFTQLMMLEDELFPGRYDKPLWVAVFVFAFAVAPFAFLIWKGSIVEAKRIDHDTKEN